MTLRYQITNVVAKTQLSHPVNLYALSTAGYGTYEPEKFPGIRLKFEGKVLLVFKTGQIILPGFKDESEIVSLLEKLEPILAKYKQEVPTNEENNESD